MIAALFSKLLSYPDKDIRKNNLLLIDEIKRTLEKPTADTVTDYLKIFNYFLEKTTLTEQEEVYTQTFEVQSITTLDVGYILFGDDYKRAELLVNMNRELVRLNISTGTELSDYLPNMLLLVNESKDQSLKEEVINHFIYPAVKRMINDFDSRIIEKKKEVYLKHQKALIEKSKEFQDVYSNILIALKIWLEQAYNAHEIIIESKSNGFLSSIEQEMNIEKIK
ncbi:MAG: hypothetical protein OHK0036_03330 [Bacteroidia bacterium]